MKKIFTLDLLPEKLGICRFGKHAPIPDWAEHNCEFFSLTKTHDELSIVCPQDRIPEDVRSEKNWRAFKLEGSLDMYSVGVIAKLSAPLAKAGISIFDISTYETDYILVEEKNLQKAKKALAVLCEIKEIN
jgi:uncharacterized protein